MRRRAAVRGVSLLTVVAAVVASVVAVVVTAAPAAMTAARAATADETTSFQIDSLHSGGLSGGTQRPPLAKRWTRDLGGVVQHPLAAAGQVFALAPTPHQATAISFATTLYALDASTGRDTWGPIDLGARAGFTYGDGQVFVVNADGITRSFDAATGRQRWIVRSEGARGDYPAPPVYRNGILYVMGSATGGQILALAGGTGQVLWQAFANGAENAPLASDDLVYTTDLCGPAQAHDARTGTVRWNYPPDGCSGGWTDATPVLGAGLLWIRSLYNRLPTAFDAATGKLVVSFTAQAPPAFDSTRGYFLVNGVLEARDPRSQLAQWSFPGDGKLTAAPIVVNGFVYASSASGQVWALDAATGQVAWSDNVGAPVLTSGENVYPPQPRVGLAAGQGLVLVPATNLLVAYANAGAPAPASSGALATASGAATAPATTPAGPDESTSYGLGPSHSGSMLTGVQRPPYRTRWTRDFGATVQYTVAAEGAVFAVAGENLFAIDAATGQDRWPPIALGPGSGVQFSNLAYGDGKVFAASFRSPLQAFDAATGEKLWSVQFTEYGTEYFASPPVYAHGLVYAQTDKMLLHALVADTGREAWRNHMPGGHGGGPAVTESGVIGYGQSIAAASLDPGTGERLWRTTDFGWDTNGLRPPAVVDGRVWMASRATPVVLEEVSGALLAARSGATPAVDGPRTYTLDGLALKARDADTGFTLWTFTGDGQLRTDPIVLNGHVYVGSATGTVWALDPATGTPVWSGQAGAPIVRFSGLDNAAGQSLGAGQGLLLVPASNRLVAFEPVSPGTPLPWTPPPPSPAPPSPSPPPSPPGGSPKAWGFNAVGELGDGTTTNRTAPTAIAGLTDAVAFAAGPYHSLALRSDGTVWAWGWNGVGSLGDGTTTDRSKPVQVPGLTGVTGIAAGWLHSVAVRGDGTVWAWGWNGVGSVGDGTTVDRHSPVRVAGLSGVTQIAAGGHHALAVLGDGTVSSWGWNAFGQLGEGTSADRHRPVRVAALSDVRSISAGLAHSLAAKRDGTVWGWGWNAGGQLGDGTRTDRSTVTAVAGLSNVVAVSGGFLHSLALGDDGRVRSWGWNGEGALGDGTTTDRLTAVPVPGLWGLTGVAAGGLHSVAWRDDGWVFTWGWNAVGQLGYGSTTDRETPAPVPGLAGVDVVGTGAHHVLTS